MCIISGLHYKVKDQVRISFKDTKSRFYEKTIENFKNLLLINIPSYRSGLVRIGDIGLKGNTFHLVSMHGIHDMLFFLLSSILPKSLQDRRKYDIHKVDEVEITLFNNHVHIQIDGEGFTERIGSDRKLTIKAAGRIRFFR